MTAVATCNDKEYMCVCVCVSVCLSVCVLLRPFSVPGMYYVLMLLFSRSVMADSSTLWTVAC